MRILLFLSLLAVPCSAQTIRAQNPNAEFSSSVPTSGHSFPDGDTTQIGMEIRIVTAPPKLLNELRSNNLARSAPKAPEMSLPEVSDAQLADAGGIQLVSARTIVETQSPVFIEHMNVAAVRRVLDKVQNSEDGNIISAPRVTLFNRQVADIRDSISRPFVVGVKPVGPELQPQIQAIEDGSQIVIRCRKLKNDGVRIDLRARISDITHVGTVTAGPHGVTLQVPKVHSHDVQVSANIPKDETLAIWGIYQDTTAVSEQRVMPGVPYVSRMFRNTAIGTQRKEILILLSPRVISDEARGTGQPVDQALSAPR